MAKGLFLPGRARAALWLGLAWAAQLLSLASANTVSSPEDVTASLAQDVDFHYITVDDRLGRSVPYLSLCPLCFLQTLLSEAAHPPYCVG